MSQEEPIDVEAIGESFVRDLEPADQELARHAMRAGAAVHAAVLTLQGAALAVPFGVDLDDVESLWSASLTEFDAESILGAARDWVEDATVWPTLSEFRLVVESKQTAAHRPERVQEPGSICPECDTEADDGGVYGTNAGRVFTSDPSKGGIATSRPCSLCRPEQHAAWKAGCMMPNHRGCAKCNPRLRKRSKARAR